MAYGVRHTAVVPFITSTTGLQCLHWMFKSIVSIYLKFKPCLQGYVDDTGILISTCRKSQHHKFLTTAVPRSLPRCSARHCNSAPSFETRGTKKSEQNEDSAQTCTESEPMPENWLKQTFQLIRSNFSALLENFSATSPRQEKAFFIFGVGVREFKTTAIKKLYFYSLKECVENAILLFEACFCNNLFMPLLWCNYNAGAIKCRYHDILRCKVQQHWRRQQRHQRQLQHQQRQQLQQ